MTAKWPAWAYTGQPPTWAVEWGEDEHGVFVAFAVGEVVQRLRWIPPGEFLMGSPESEPERWYGEGPQHEVTIGRGLWLAETPVTQRLWIEVMGRSTSRFGGDGRRPADRVSWNDAQAFIEVLNGRTGLALRLPTEAEWEYSCRAGTSSRFWSGESEEDLARVAWYEGNSARTTHPVGMKPPNPWGLFDMHGNVWEWCQDFAYRSYENASVDPIGSTASDRRVARGGSWRRAAAYASCAHRGANEVDWRGDSRGLRLALESREPSTDHPRMERLSADSLSSQEKVESTRSNPEVVDLPPAGLTEEWWLSHQTLPDIMLGDGDLVRHANVLVLFGRRGGKPEPESARICALRGLTDEIPNQRSYRRQGFTIRTSDDPGLPHVVWVAWQPQDPQAQLGNLHRALSTYRDVLDGEVWMQGPRPWIGARDAAEWANNVVTVIGNIVGEPATRLSFTFSLEASARRELTRIAVSRGWRTDAGLRPSVDSPQVEGESMSNETNIGVGQVEGPVVGGADRKSEQGLGADEECYAITLSHDESGASGASAATHWVGWKDMDSRMEIREASLLDAQERAAMWERLGWSFVVVRTKDELAAFMRNRGRALVSPSLVEEFVPEWKGPYLTKGEPIRGAIRRLLRNDDSLVVAADTPKHILFVPTAWRDLDVLATACDTSSKGSDTQDLLHFEFKDSVGPLTLRLYVGAAPQRLRQRAIDVVESDVHQHLFEGRAKRIGPVHGLLWGVTIYSGPQRKTLTVEERLELLHEAWQRNRKHIDRLTQIFADHFAG